MRLDRLAALLAVLAVALAGTWYVTQRPTVWASDAQVVLVPAPVSADETSPLESFVSGGTLNTTVEMLASPDLAAQVPQPGVTFTARAIPDSRVIALHATGPRDAVQPALSTLLARANPAQRRLADRWRLAALTRPTAPEAAGPTTATLGVATGLLALLAGVAVLVGARRVVPDLAAHRVGRRRRPRASVPLRRRWRVRRADPTTIVPDRITAATGPPRRHRATRAARAGAGERER